MAIAAASISENEASEPVPGLRLVVAGLITVELIWVSAIGYALSLLLS